MRPGARVAAELLLHLQHLLIDEQTDHGIADPAGSNRVLHALLQAFAAPFGRSHAVAHGEGDLEPWRVLTDPAVAPVWALPYAAQFAGGVVPPRLDGETDDAYLARARQAVVFPRGMKRGGAEAIRIAVEATLTGSRRVFIRERANDDAWSLYVHTLSAETPDPGATRREAESVAAAGVVVTVVPLDGQTYQDVAAKHADYGAVAGAYSSYGQMAVTPP